MDTLQRILQAILVVCTLGSGLALGQTGTTKNDDVLRLAASPTAAPVAPIPANIKVEVVKRKGFWAQVKVGNTTGWLKLSSLNLDKGSAGASKSALSGLASGRTGYGNIVSASGTRRLSAEALKAAKTEVDTVAQVRKFAVSAAEATRYAQAGGLQTRQVAYISVAEDPLQWLTK
jgi:hypothetical protein